MKTLRSRVFSLLALAVIAAVPAPPEPASPSPVVVDSMMTGPALVDHVVIGPAPAGSIVIAVPAPLTQLSPCFKQCIAIREECHAGCSTTGCHHECGDSAVTCLSNC